jgi:EpsD family peptidyl-prolyl cis-trans isomerase
MIYYGKLSLIAAMLIMLGGCGDKTANEATKEHAAMKVNGQAISAAEVAAQLQQYQGMSADQKASVTEKMLASLADSEMLRQAALTAGLDQEPTLRIRLNATQRLILANAYIEKTMAAVSVPSEAEIKSHYEQNPDRYAKRKVFDLQEISLGATPEQVAAIHAKLAEKPSLQVLMDWIYAQQMQPMAQHLVAPAEKVLAPVLEKLGKAERGETLALTNKDRLVLLHITDIQIQPLQLAEAAPLIREQLLEARKATAMESMLKQLREKTEIEYLPPYQAAAKPAAKP